MFLFLCIRDEQTKNKFEEIYYAYSKYLYTTGLKILKDEELASDALQQCFFKIFKKIDQFEDIHSKQTKAFFAIIMRDEALADETEFNQWDKEDPDICVPKTVELKILDMADNFNKLLLREKKRKRLKKYIQAATMAVLAATTVLTILIQK